MKRRMIAAVTLAVALAGGIGFAQGGGRVLQSRYLVPPEPAVGDVLADCSDFGAGDFLLLNDWQYSIHDAMLLDQNGQPKQLVENLKVVMDVIYNSKTGKSVAAGPGESEQLRLLFENGLPVTHRWSGLLFKVTVPGYGLIVAESGRATWQWDPLGGSHWVISNSGHNQWVDRDLAALCEYLK